MEQCSFCLILHWDVTWKHRRTVLLLEFEINFLVKNIFQHQPVHQECWESPGVSWRSGRAGSVWGPGAEPALGGALGSQSICWLQSFQQRTGTLLEVLDVICGCWYILASARKALALRCSLLVMEHQAAGRVGVVAAWGVKIPEVLIASNIPPFKSFEEVIGQVMALKEYLHPQNISLLCDFQTRGLCTRHCFAEKAKELVLPTPLLLGLFLFLQLFVLEDLCCTIHLFFPVFCAQCSQAVQVNHKNSLTCSFPPQQKCIYFYLNTERNVLQLWENVVLFSSLCWGLGDPSLPSPRGSLGVSSTSSAPMLGVLW